MIWKHVCVAAFGSFALLAAQAAHAQDKLIIATEAGYMPWNGTAPDGTLIGFEIEMAEDLCRRMNVTCSFVTQDFDGMIPSLVQNRFDLAMSSMMATEERRQSISFSIPYGNAASYFVVSEDSPLAAALGEGGTLDVTGLDLASDARIAALRASLAGAVVGLSAGTTHLRFAQQALLDSDLRTYDRTESVFLDLLAGRIDTTLQTRSVIEDFLRSPSGANSGFKMVGPAIEGGVLGEGISFGVRKEDTELKARLDEAIRAAISDGTLGALSEKWFSYDLTPQP